jgi:hypothetical protein
MLRACVLLALCCQMEFSGKFRSTGQREETKATTRDDVVRSLDEWGKQCLTAKSLKFRTDAANALSRIALLHRTHRITLSDAELGVIRSLAKKLASNDEGYARRAACDIARLFDSDESRLILEASLRDKYSFVCESAIAGLIDIGDAGSVSKLAGVVATEKLRDTQVKAIRAIAAIGIKQDPSAAIKALEGLEKNKALASVHEEVRRAMDAIAAKKD